MAQYALRIRRAIPLTSSVLTHRPPSLSSIVSPAVHPPPTQPLPSPNPNPNPNPSAITPFQFQSRSFRSTATLLSPPPPRSRYNFDSETINPDDILFEGCDYNHWLITMDFPKDPRPSDEQMVEAYVQTAAQVLGSREEAMKKMYACSTTTYHGFQVQVTEEESEKFRGLPGVVFILPDSYIDPVNKEYGGDKYENGIITRRPPPITHGRQQGNYRSPRGAPQHQNYQNAPRGPMQQGPPPQQNYQNLPRGPMQQGPPQQQNYQNLPRGPMQQAPPPQQNYQNLPRGPMQQGPPLQQNYQNPLPKNDAPGGQGSFQVDRRESVQAPPLQQNYQNLPRGPMQQGPPLQQNYQNPLPMYKAPGGQGSFQADRRESAPPYQGNYNQGERQDYYPSGQRDFRPQDQRNVAPSDRRDFGVNDRNYAPSPGGNSRQGWGGNSVPGVDRNYEQRSGDSYRQGLRSNDWQGGNGNYDQGFGGAHGQGMGAGYTHGSTGQSE